MNLVCATCRAAFDPATETFSRPHRQTCHAPYRLVPSRGQTTLTSDTPQDTEMCQENSSTAAIRHTGGDPPGDERMRFNNASEEWKRGYVQAQDEFTNAFDGQQRTVEAIERSFQAKLRELRVHYSLLSAGGIVGAFFGGMALMHFVQ